MMKNRTSLYYKTQLRQRPCTQSKHHITLLASAIGESAQVLLVVALPTVSWSIRCSKLSELHNCPFEQLEDGWFLRATPAHPLFFNHGLSQIIWRATAGKVQEATRSVTGIWILLFMAVRCISHWIKWQITRYVQKHPSGCKYKDIKDKEDFKDICFICSIFLVTFLWLPSKTSSI